MTCRICKRKYSYDYEVTDEDWKFVTGIQNGGGAICIDCFDEMAYIKKYKYTLIQFIFPEWYKWKEEYIG